MRQRKTLDIAILQDNYRQGCGIVGMTTKTDGAKK